ncbi:MAG: transcription elongation factor GreA [Nitrospirota bacterium]
MRGKIPITKDGYEKLKEELTRLKKVERPKNIQEIAEARSHGDLSENAEYHAAKERQSLIARKIHEIERKLAAAHIIDTSKLYGEKVVFGARVRLINLETNEEKIYTLVGEEETDLKNGKISILSPVGKALIGHQIGDIVTIKAPARTIEYEILEIGFE